MLRSGLRWGSLQCSPEPLAGGEGLDAPTKNPTPALGLTVGLACPRPLILRPIPDKVLATALKILESKIKSD